MSKGKYKLITTVDELALVWDMFNSTDREDRAVAIHLLLSTDFLRVDTSVRHALGDRVYSYHGYRLHHTDPDDKLKLIQKLKSRGRTYYGLYGKRALKVK